MSASTDVVSRSWSTWRGRILRNGGGLLWTMDPFYQDHPISLAGFQEVPVEGEVLACPCVFGSLVPLSCSALFVSLVVNDSEISDFFIQ